MKFWEAMKAYDEGKEIRIVYWTKGSYISQKCSCGVDWMDYMSWAYCLDKEWELYEEPQQTYSFMQILPMLKEGKRFKRKNWEGWIAQRGGAIVNEQNDIGNYLLMEDFEAADWVEVK